MRIPILAALGAFLLLTGCNPVVYVPSSIPMAPTSAGIRASAGLNAIGSQGTASLEVAPVEGVGLYARGLYANTLTDQESGGAFVNRGAELGVVGSVLLSDQASLDMGAFVGRDNVRASDFGFDIGCCSGSYTPVDIATRREGGHVGVLIGRKDSRGIRRRIGPALRMVRTGVFRERQDGTVEDGVGLFVEPALRLDVSSPGVELLFQVGASVQVGSDFTRYAHVPFTAGATASIPLARFR